MKNIRQFHLLSSILGGVFLFSSCSVVPKAEEKNLSEQWPGAADAHPSSPSQPRQS